eukprot:COSAG02_NODE_35789_length_463_cov_0.986264_1_plen_56_part_00
MGVRVKKVGLKLGSQHKLLTHRCKIIEGFDPLLPVHNATRFDNFHDVSHSQEGHT